MTAPNNLPQNRCDVDNLDLRALLLVFALGDGICHHELLQCALLDALDSAAGEYAVRHNGVDFLGTSLDELGGGETDRPAGVGHVVDEDGVLPLHATDEYHARNLVRAFPLFVEEREVNAKSICDRGRTVFVESAGSGMSEGKGKKRKKGDLPLRATSVRRDDCYVWDVKILADIVENRGLCVQLGVWKRSSQPVNREADDVDAERDSNRTTYTVDDQSSAHWLELEDGNALVHRDIKEALYLRSVQVHRLYIMA